MERDIKNPLTDIELVAFDVDGVFTDGRFYLCDDGHETKAFNTQDGYGVRQLINSGVIVAVISGRNSLAVEIRMQELGVDHVIQGCADKVSAFDALLEEHNIDVAQSVFVGDDAPDLQLLQRAGFSIAVANAVEAVKNHCDYVTERSGGSGAVREVCELILSARGTA